MQTENDEPHENNLPTDALCLKSSFNSQRLATKKWQQAGLQVAPE